MKKAPYGQSIVEYLMIGGVAAFTIFACWLALSSSLNDLLKGVGNNMSDKGESAIAAKPSPKPVVGSPTGPMVDVEITLSDGTILKLKDMPANLSTLVETSGANGTTDHISLALEDLAKKLRDAGEITEEQAAALVELANQGHRMAAIQRTIEQGIDAANKAGIPISEYVVTFEGQEIPLRNLANRVGMLRSTEDAITKAGYNILSVPDEFANDPAHWPNIGRDLGKLRELYLAANKDGALNNPLINQIVTKMALDIGYIGEAVEHNVWQIQLAEKDAIDAGNPPPKYTSDLFNDMVGATDSVTDDKSGTICKSGDNIDNGIKCYFRGKEG